jgi:hypothetical protein
MPFKYLFARHLFCINLYVSEYLTLKCKVFLPMGVLLSERLFWVRTGLSGGPGDWPGDSYCAGAKNLFIFFSKSQSACCTGFFWKRFSDTSQKTLNNKSTIILQRRVGKLGSESKTTFHRKYDISYLHFLVHSNI